MVNNILKAPEYLQVMLRKLKKKAIICAAH